MSYGAILGQNNYVKRTGDTMTGPLVLPGDPTEDLQAATKQYVDNLPISDFLFKQQLFHTSVLTNNNNTDYFYFPDTSTLQKIPTGFSIEVILNNVSIKSTNSHLQLLSTAYEPYILTVLHNQMATPQKNWSFSLIYFFCGVELDDDIVYGMLLNENGVTNLYFDSQERYSLDFSRTNFTGTITVKFYLFY